MNIFIGNLAREVTDEDLRAAFEEFGQVSSASVVKDKFTRDSRGFGFVEMPSQEEAQAAISGLNGKELKGRAINVSEARPRSQRSGGSFGRDRTGGSRGRGGGGRRTW